MPWQSETPPKAGADAPAFSVGDHDKGPPDYLLRVWPHQSGSLTALRTAIIVIAAGLSLPLWALAGGKVGWAVLPFLIAAIAALFFAFKVNVRRAETISDVLRLWPDLLTVEHTDQRGEVSKWEANPYWVTTRLHDNAKLESYLTLKGNGREIELGAFLSPDERVSLFDEVSRALRSTAAQR